MRRPLAGRAVLITSGPTREPLDPVRYLSNSSSGAMGWALAAAARAAGARVTVVSGPVALPPPPGVRVVRVTTAREMRREVLRRAGRAAAVIGAAAVADWRPAKVSRAKLKRGAGAARLTLIPNPDIIRDAASRRRPGQAFVGFALETTRAEARAREKLARKGLDLVVANGPATLSSGRIRAALVLKDRTIRLPESSKLAAARRVVAAIVRILEQGT